MADLIKFSSDVILVPAATTSSVTSGGVTTTTIHPGSAQLEDKDIVDVSAYERLELQIDLLSYDIAYTRPGTAPVGLPEHVADHRPIILEVRTGMDPTARQMSTCAATDCGANAGDTTTSVNFLRAPDDSTPSAVLLQYAGWVLSNYSTDKPAVVRIRGLARRGG